MKILILGSGGHGQVVADILLCMKAKGHIFTPIGFLDDNISLENQLILGLPQLGTIDNIDSIEFDAAIIGIGNNAIRQKIFKTLSQKNIKFITLIHPQSIIAANTKIGVGTSIAAGVIINAGTSVGDNVILNTGCTVDHHCRIADHVHIAPGVNLGGDVTVGTGTLVGIGATVIPQKTIGEWATVGAGALVHRDVESTVTVTGVPAQKR